uniref:Mitochondrial carrier protein n=1 Tax=Noctiluca scintillans TaxID=2966 RepID=A0A7S0ZWP4_NOCSC
MDACEDPLRKLSAHQNLVLGVTAGSVDQLLLQPMLYWKNSLQQGLPFTMNPKLLYRGTAASMGNMGFTTGQQFLTAGVFQNFLTGGAGQEMTYGQEVAAAWMGGAASGPLCGFMELIMIQQQRFGGSLWGTPARLVRERGLSVLLRGGLCTVGRESIYAAGYLGIVPVTQKLFTDTYGLSPHLGSFVGATVGGLACAALSQPLDTAKTCMQGDVERKKYTNAFQTLKTLHVEYGSVKALYRGYWWRGANIVVEFILLDWLSKRLAPIMYPKLCGPGAS